MSSKKRKAVKVILMDTQYVEADPTSFKSVVQKLTGKDSCVAWIKESNSADVIKREISVKVDKLEDAVNVDYRRDQMNVTDNNGSSVSMLSKGKSFKDLDSLIMEVLPPDQLQLLWTEYNLH